MSHGDLFERIRAIPIESVVREYFPNLELNHSGRDLVTICPFHSEKTPSFKINTETNRWKCFGCHKGGSNIDLLLAGELFIEPVDAAKDLARKFKIDTSEEKPRRKAKTLTVAEYADFCALPENFLLETFSLTNDEAGIEIPYKDESGATISVQRRHKLERATKKISASRGARAIRFYPTAFGSYRKLKIGLSSSRVPAMFMF